MKKIISTAVATMTLIGTLACSAQALDIDFDFSNVLIKHRQFLADETPEYTEFHIINFDDADNLKSCSDEMHFSKEVYDLATLEATDPNTIFEGFTGPDGNKFIVEDAADFYRVIFYFADLDQTENLQAAIDCGFIMLDGENRDISSIHGSDVCNMAINAGEKEISATDLSNYDLKFNID